jgi:hypothetical protein
MPSIARFELRGLAYTEKQRTQAVATRAPTPDPDIAVQDKIEVKP